MKRIVLILAAVCCIVPLQAAQRTRSIRHIVVAAANSPKEDKHLADFVCTGKNDERTINKAIASLKYGGKIQLLDGDYYIDAFEQEGNSAIYFGYNEGRGRTITIEGTTENKSYNTQYGASFHVTEAAMNAMDDNTTYRVFYGDSKKPAEGYYRYTFVNCANFENFLLFFHNAKKKLVGLDCSCFGNTYISLVGIYTEKHFAERYLHQKPENPVEGCIGVISPRRSNDDTSRLAFDTICIGGLYIGIKTIGVDHLIMTNCSVARCVVGYWFQGKSFKTLTMINCADEGNTHLPRFTSFGQLTCIDFNIERFNAEYIPEDPTGNTEHRCWEETPGEWHGFISYTLQGNAYGLDDGKLWAEGSGRNFVTVDLKKEASSWPL